MATAVNPHRKRRSRGSLTRDQVVDAALAIADASGLEALSMPSLARHLDCGVMTLYGHVENKGDLLDAIAQRGLRDLRLDRPLPAGADGILAAWGAALRRVLIDHPALPAIFLTRPVIGPGIFRGVEALVDPLRSAGLPPARAVHAIYAVLVYTVGYVAWEIPRTRRQPEAEYAAAWRREFANLDASQFPAVASLLDELGAVAGERQFELGLAALVSGLAGAIRPRGRT